MEEIHVETHSTENQQREQFLCIIVEDGNCL